MPQVAAISVDSLYQMVLAVPHGRPTTFRVSAVAVFDTQIVPATATNGQPEVLLSPPYNATPIARASGYGTEAAVRLRPGASMAAFTAAAVSLAKRHPGTGGRWAWALFAGSAGVSPQADVPVPLVLLIIPVALALASVIAAGPGWTAARIRPALVLRSE
jgi:hypothetical protein